MTTRFRQPNRSHLASIFIGLGALTLLAGCGEEDVQQTAARPPPAVTVAPVVASQVTTSIEYVGRTYAMQQVDLRARVTGFLTQRSFEEGGRVEAGQPLFRIDPSEYEAARKAAAAAVERADATLVEARQTLARSRELAARGTVSQAKLDEGVAAEAQARADLDAVKAELERAALNLSWTIVETPIAGRAGAAGVDVGNLIGPESGVLTTVVDIDPIRVEFAISERELLTFRQRQQTGTVQTYTPRLRLANGEMFEPAGTITFIDNRVDPRTGTIRLRAEFPNPNGLVVPGQFVNVVLSGSEPRDEMVVPQAAVQSNQTGAFVLVVGADGTVEARQVTLGQRSGTGIVVAEGLQPGETIIVEGLQKARTGAKVTPVPVQQTPGTAPGGS